MNPSNTHDYFAGLNPEQREAVGAGDGPVLVVAGPGSGKTRVLTQRIAFLIGERCVAPSRIFASTFTNKAAREMKERLQRLVGPDAVQELTIGTFHAFGVKVLRQNSGLASRHLPIRSGFSIFDDADQIAAVKRAIVATGLDPKDVAPRRVLSRISAAKSKLLDPADLSLTAEHYDQEVVARIYTEYQRVLEAANAVDFDDLLVLPIRLFDAVPSVLTRYQEQFIHILVDEYQDTNRVQYVLVTALAAGHRNLFVVGDPDQSIYGWRQADIRNILDFGRDFPDAVRLDLETNYRSTARIVAVADRLIQENTQRIDRSLRTDNPDGERVSIRELADQDHEAHFVVDEIRRLLHSPDLNPSGIAVMYRTTAQSRALEEALRISEIPYQIVGGARFYERREVKDVLAVLRLLGNPSDTIALERLTEHMNIGRGIGPKAIASVASWSAARSLPILEGFIALAENRGLEAAPQLSGPATSAASRIGSAFEALRPMVSTAPLVDIFDSLVHLTGYDNQFDRTVEEENDRWNNVLEVRADLARFDTLPPGEALASYLEQVALTADVDTMKDDPEGAITLITLHSSKGLEYPVVFVVGVEEGLLPISRAIEVERSDPSQMEEERRLLYVGITRAKDLLYLTHAGSRMTYGRFQAGVQSRFLRALPAEHISETSRRQASRPLTESLVGRIRTQAAVDSRSPQLREFTVNELVFHPKFGEGTIIETVDRRGDQELSILFLRHGQKRLLASLASLEVIERAG